jgi:hypothetical protein
LNHLRAINVIIHIRRLLHGIADDPARGQDDSDPRCSRTAALLAQSINALLIQWGEIAQDLLL